VNGPAGRLSLFITLGIAAIDMLSCAFVSSILLFVMFLLPAHSVGGGATGTENLLIINWSFSSRYSTALRIELDPPGDVPRIIWSDDPGSIDKVCSNLSQSLDYSNACYLVLPTDPNDLDGMLIIEQPRRGGWKVVVRSSDTTSHMNAGDDQPVDFLLTVIGKESFSRSVNNLMPGSSVELSSDISALHVD
jgi:hypothetical protein